jgi:ribosomal protein S18 acetylase RimI-like enzyme
MESTNLHFEYFEATEPAHYAAAVELIKEYMAFLNEDLCFQSVDKEMENLPAMYSGTSGSLLLCRSTNGQYAGMVAIRQKGDGICEMKRLYVRPQFQGHSIGKKLSEMIIAKAKELGYKTMVLDTLERLQPALKLYTQLGFERTGAYYQNPLAQVVYMAKNL